MENSIFFFFNPSLRKYKVLKRKLGLGNHHTIILAQKYLGWSIYLHFIIWRALNLNLGDFELGLWLDWNWNLDSGFSAIILNHTAQPIKYITRKLNIYQTRKLNFSSDFEILYIKAFKLIFSGFQQLFILKIWYVLISVPKKSTLLCFNNP